MPFICLLELVALLYFYRSHDFISDMNIATEENACSSRIGTQWQILPAIVLVRINKIINSFIKNFVMKRTVQQGCWSLNVALDKKIIKKFLLSP